MVSEGVPYRTEVSGLKIDYNGFLLAKMLSILSIIMANLDNVVDF